MDTGRSAWMERQAVKAEAAMRSAAGLDMDGLIALLAYLCGRVPAAVEDGVVEVARVRAERAL
jgi:hypothetical protein